MSTREDNIEYEDVTEIGEEKRAPETKEEKKPTTNFTVMEALSAKLIAFIKSQNISTLTPLIKQFETTSVQTKIAFVKQRLCSRVHGLRGLIADYVKAEKVAVNSESIDKVARYLEAMCEVCDQ